MLQYSYLPHLCWIHNPQTKSKKCGRDHYGYGPVNERRCYYNVVSHGLSTYPEWSLHGTNPNMSSNAVKLSIYSPTLDYKHLNNQNHSKSGLLLKYKMLCSPLGIVSLNQHIMCKYPTNSELKKMINQNIMYFSQNIQKSV